MTSYRASNNLYAWNLSTELQQATLQM